MIQFNLLPDIKVAFEKTRRLKRLIMLAAGALSALSLVIFIFLLVLVYGIQKKSISDLNGTIKSDSSQLLKTPDLNKILTVKNQLVSLPALDNQKPVASRLFQYITQITPAQATISNMAVNFTAGSNQPGGSAASGIANADSITITGNADTWATVNTYVDTLKFTTFTQDGNSPTNNSPFSNVDLESFSISNSGTTYSISFNFNPVIFDSSHTISLVVPNIVTTRSEIDQPTNLFQKAPTSSTTGGH